MNGTRVRSAGVGDIAVVVALLAVGLSGLQPAYGGAGLLVAVAAGLVAGTGVAWLGAWRRWGTGLVAMVLVVVYFLLAGPLAYRSLLVVGAVPTATSLRASALGAITTWKGVVTAATPLSAFPELVVAPLILALVGSALAASWAVRARRYGWALVPVVAVFAASLLLGTSVAWAPVERGAAIGVVAFGWLAWRRAAAEQPDLANEAPTDAADRRALVRRRVSRSAAMLALVAVVATTAGFAVAHADRRFSLRQDAVPPLDLREYPSPLESFRQYVTAQKNTVLFQVSGLPSGARLRLAVLDTYTGAVMNVAGGDRSAPSASGEFERGSVQFLRAAASAPQATTATVTVTSVGYTGRWLPTPGVPQSMTFAGKDAAQLTPSLYVNPVTGTSVTTTSLAPGDSYTVDATLPPQVGSTDLHAQTLEPALSGGYQLDAAGSQARTLTGSTSGGPAQIQALADALTKNGTFSNGDGAVQSPPGHGAKRITDLLTGNPMVGDDEQYAVAAALMAESLGYQARVVMGFYPDASKATSGGTVDITGADVHAWLEVDVRGTGWVAYTVTPDQNKTPQQKSQRANAAPQPQVLQEPKAPQPPAQAPQPPVADQKAPDHHDKGGVRIPWGLIGGGAGGLLLLVGPLVLIGVAKARRRKRRRTAALLVDRVSGGWHEVTDAAVDLGSPVMAGATRRETAADLGRRFPDAVPAGVAERADAVVFGGGEPTPAEVEAFWAEVDALISDMRRGSPTWAKARAALSLRSLRLSEVIRARSARLIPGWTLRRGDARR